VFRKPAVIPSSRKHSAWCSPHKELFSVTGHHSSVILRYAPETRSCPWLVTGTWLLNLTSRQRTYKRNIEVRSRNHCCRGKAMNITFLECVCVCVLKQSACAILYCRLWPVCLYQVFPYYLINGTVFREKSY